MCSIVKDIIAVIARHAIIGIVGENGSKIGRVRCSAMQEARERVE